MDQPVIRPGQGQREGAHQDPRLDWWRDAKFGMFIHWGLYAIPAGVWKGQPVDGIGEWIMHRARIPVAEYEQLAAQFNPTKFDAEAIVTLAREAGQKYIMLTAKHHDGFCMYDSAHTTYDIIDATPFGRDPMKELADECQRQGLRFGFYYSQTQDWHHPGGDGNDWDYDDATRDFDGYIEDYVKPQLRELLTNYGPIAAIWFDTPRRIRPEQSRELLDLVRGLQPECLVNGRLGNDLGDFAESGDNVIPAELLQMDWEVPATINDTWGFKTADENWKSVPDLIRKLVDVASKGGVYLLNIGPTADGTVPEASAERLRGVGQWLQVNGESIYGTRPGPVQGLHWCRSTQGRGKVYLHVLDWPEQGTVRVPAFGQTVTGAYLLADRQLRSLTVHHLDGEVLVKAPEAPPDPVDTVIVLEVE